MCKGLSHGYFEQTVNRLDALVGVLIEDAEHGHVGEEVDGTHLDAVDFEAQPLLQVGLQLVVTLGFDQIDIVVFHILAPFVALGEEVLAQPHAEDEDTVDN